MTIQDYRTPQWYFDYLNNAFGEFKLDAFACKNNALCYKYYKEQDNALKCDWIDKTFANPPFALAGEAVKKAWREWTHNNINSTLIVPAGCVQYWMHDYAIHGTIFLPNMRINFDSPEGKPTKRSRGDTMVICFGYDYENTSRNITLGRFKVERLDVRD
jgi:phage N-6-adenine-methyltransferase